VKIPEMPSEASSLLIKADNTMASKTKMTKTINDRQSTMHKPQD